jgi:hypothetical protein
MIITHPPKIPAIKRIHKEVRAIPKRILLRFNERKLIQSSYRFPRLIEMGALTEILKHKMQMSQRVIPNRVLNINNPAAILSGVFWFSPKRMNK